VKRPLTSLIVTAILVAGTTAGGFIHGQMSNRWGPHADSREAARRLADPLPERVGNWVLRRETELEEGVVKLLHCPSYISRVYEHNSTGDVVSVAVLLGPPGPISVHTPEICYSGHDYSVEATRRRATLTDSSGEQHTFWEVGLKANRREDGKLKVLYGWGVGGPFQAAESPRFGFGGVTHLYKVQLAALDVSGKEDFNPSEDFLKSFLPQLTPRLLHASH